MHFTGSVHKENVVLTGLLNAQLRLNAARQNQRKYEYRSLPVHSSILQKTFHLIPKTNGIVHFAPRVAAVGVLPQFKDVRLRAHNEPIQTVVLKKRQELVSSVLVDFDFPAGCQPENFCDLEGGGERGIRTLGTSLPGTTV
jgi:hypothetical protein